MAKYLLDSDVLIWILRNRRDTIELVDQLAQAGGEPLACSTLSVLEILVGAKPSEISRTATLLKTMEAIPVDMLIVQQAAELIKTHQHTKNPRQWIDALIAATALDCHLTLVTYNQRDYPYRNLILYPLKADS